MVVIHVIRVSGLIVNALRVTEVPKATPTILFPPVMLGVMGPVGVARTLLPTKIY